MFYKKISAAAAYMFVNPGVQNFLRLLKIKSYDAS